MYGGRSQKDDYFLYASNERQPDTSHEHSSEERATSEGPRLSDGDSQSPDRYM